MISRWESSLLSESTSWFEFLAIDKNSKQREYNDVDKDRPFKSAEDRANGQRLLSIANAEIQLIPQFPHLARDTLDTYV